MDAIGTGSWVDFLMFTSDITHVFEDDRWAERGKADRAGEIAVPHLDVRVQRG